jgi:hypothetical protein
MASALTLARPAALVAIWSNDKLNLDFALAQSGPLASGYSQVRAKSGGGALTVGEE